MPSPPVRASARTLVTLPPEEKSVGAARGLVVEALEGWAAEDLTDDATLLVSELATNAVVHAGTDFDVSAELLGDTVEVAVTDRHPTRTVPAPPAAVEPDVEGGRGLFLTASLAEKWGVDYTSSSKRVWFRLPLAGGVVPTPRTAAPTEPTEDDGARSGVGSVRLDAEGVVVWADATAAALLGRSLDELVGRTWLTLCDPAEAATVVAASAAARWQGSYPVVLPSGESRRLQTRHVRMAAGTTGPAASAVVLVDHRLRALLADVPSSVTATVPSAAAHGPFAHSPEALVRLELGELLERTVAWARDLLGGDGAYVLLVSGDDDALELRAAVGLRPDVERVPRRIGEGISGRVSRDLMPVVHDDLADVLVGPAGARSAEPWLVAAGVRSLVAVPVLAEGRLIGTVGVTAARPSAFSVADGAGLQRGVDEVALALQSARVTEIERRRHGWLGYLAEAGELLAGTLEPDMALALVAQLVTPRLGPWCAIYLADGSGRATRATEWHADEDQLDALRAYLDTAPVPDPPTAGVGRWLPALNGRVDGDARLLSEAGGHAAALIARGRALGTLVLGHDSTGAERGRRQELHLLADVAPRAALALDNARLYAERTATSRALQRSLLPTELPALHGVDIGVVYEASGEGNDVGGDFYDVFPLDESGPDGEGAATTARFAFAVGDVCGKGPEAAAVTGLARHALRLLGRRGDDIPAVLGHLNSAVLAEGPRARFVTLLYGEARRLPDGALHVRFASAGHPAPVVLRADGTAGAVGSGGDLLGVFAQATTVVDELTLAPGDALICFTDGVTERRDDVRMLGEDGVLAALTGATGLDAAGLARRLEEVVSTFTTAPARDDVAILVLRPRPPGG